ncbi:hypothetical protein BWI96_03110 [Siphonobacter sp. SORGH_AS_0500]|uniref:hypothetical protein n=1 Tax=Siphonobacter sp. SORGH_AS_0500 TaxID=1864824 RepID=UPI000CBE54A4|nr:hypothetical protein [Siphonobacter sp. SORGH_AS_0500]PKK38083.1 hypothetical protein BWI96_03110 [Siphonobacter sp. SORGH_AS_0500]
MRILWLRTFYFSALSASVLLLTQCNNDGGRKRGNQGVESDPVTETASVTEAPADKPAPKNLKAKLYLEASGSMFPYDAAGSTGEFDEALQNLLTPFEAQKPGSTELFVVNDNVYPMGVNFQQLVEQPNVFTLAKDKGDSRHTDFSLIFKTILSDLKEGEVGVLFSDLIYSTESTAAQSSAKILADVETLMQTTFAGKTKDKSLLILKLSGAFKGTYYPHNGGGKPYNGSRPYYIALMANNATMKALLSDEKFESLARFKDLPGFESFHYFTSASDNVPFYTILLKDAEQAGQFEQSRQERKESKEAIHTIENIEADRKTRGLTLAVGVDLGGFYLPDSYKTDPKSYEIESDEGFKIQKIVAEKGPEGYTHKFLLTTAEPQGGGKREITLRLKRKFPPSWITQTTTQDDSNPKSDDFSEKTFGILNFTRGIEKAYNPQQANTYFTITLNLH